jgi:uncharacterized phiE125 gp8 family phage protein
MLRRIAAATNWPVSLEEVKEHLEVEHDERDRLIEGYIRSAVQYVEREIEQVLVPTDFEQRSDCWTYPYIVFETGPVRGIDSVTYLDEDGAEQTVDAANYEWERTALGAHFWLADDFTQPVVLDRPGSIRIRFSAGYNDPDATPGDDDFIVPEQAKQAILLLVGHWWANREAVGPGNTAGLEFAVDALLQPIKVYRG